MILPARQLAIGFLVVASTGAIAVYGSQNTRLREADKAEQRRAAVWQALEKALPKESQRIEAYSENPSLTSILLRTENKTLQFSLEGNQGKVEEIQHMKVLGLINRITFEKDKSGANWVLWHNGQRECTIGVAGEE